MKASEYILNYLKEQGVNSAFVITGGAICPMIDAFDEKRNLEYICTTHEQGAAIAAEAYSRVTENLGVAISTSGPGATNLMTGIACAYFDSIPVLYITGQVNDYESTWKNGPRQVGFQETNIVEMAKPITKYAVRIDDPTRIKYELEKAIFIAKSERTGPVLLDLPFNTQKAELNIEELDSYSPPTKEIDYAELNKKIDLTINYLNESERPVLVLGAGVKLGKAQKKVRTLIDKLKIPVVSSWGALDILPFNHPNFVGGFGVAHNRPGNFTVQNADLLISLGSRLDSRQTGSKLETFARGAKKIILDIDSTELEKWDKKNLCLDLKLNYDVNDFIDVFFSKLDKLKIGNLYPWETKIKDWKQKFPICKPEYFEQKDKINPYIFLTELSEQVKEGSIIVADTGANLMWTMQSWKVKENQKLFSDFGHSTMGYSLPASIGASFASNKGPVVCITGDGGIKMNINELETIVKHNLPIKIFIINNHELGTIKQFQDSLFGSRYKASSIEGGLGNSDLLAVGRAYGLRTSQINNHKEMKEKIEEVLKCEDPILCSVELKNGEMVTPKSAFGKPIEDLEPLLDREEFRKLMIIPPIENKK